MGRDGESDSGNYFCVAIRTVGVFVTIVSDIANVDVLESDFFAYFVCFGQCL